MPTSRLFLSTITVRKKRSRESIVADSLLIEKVDAIASRLNFSTRTKTLKFLAEYYVAGQSSGNVPVGTFDSVISATEHMPPIVLAGIPGSGKSYTLDVLLKECTKRRQPFILFSSRAKDHKCTEHQWIPETLSYYEYPTLHWLDAPGNYRVELETDLNLRRQEMRDASQTLLRLEGDNRLSSWLVCVEEAADYYDIRSFQTLLRRMRKSCRRIVVVSTEAELFKMCQPMRPIPRVSPR